MSDVSRPFGFRPTATFAGDPSGVGWRAWVGPLLVARVRGSFPGVRLSWTR